MHPKSVVNVSGKDLFTVIFFGVFRDLNKMSSLSEKEKEEKQRLDEIRRAGFVNVDQWSKGNFNAGKQKQLLGLIKNDPSVTAV